MPAQETTHRFQKAVVWPFSSYDRYGEVIVGQPVEISVRWENTRKEAKDARGNTVFIEAVVHVNQVIPLYSHMWEGTLEDWYGTGSSGNEVNLMEVLVYRETPDIKGRAIRRIAECSRYRATQTTE
jgi:hypothetical protein